MPNSEKPMEPRREDDSFDGLPTDPHAATELTQLEDDAGAVALRPGQRVGKFTLVRELGVGGMGQVWQAREEGSGRSVAAKFIRPDRDADAAHRRRFAVEQQALARMRHPAIARVYGVGTLAGSDRPYYVMELVDGPTLDVWLAEASPSLYRRVRLVIELCDAVAHAHEREVIHRDLKPSNVLVTGRGQPKIIDFGVARLTNESAAKLTRTGFQPGSFGYMSPEQASGGKVTPLSDVYALGVIAYLMLTGQPPGHPLFGRAELTFEKTVDRLAAAQPQLRDDRNAAFELAAILTRALEKEPSHRPASAEALGTALEDWTEKLAGSGGTASTNAAAREPRPARDRDRSRPRLAITLVAALLLAGLTAAGFWFGTRAGRGSTTPLANDSLEAGDDAAGKAIGDTDEFAGPANADVSTTMPAGEAETDGRATAESAPSKAPASKPVSEAQRVAERARDEAFDALERVAAEMSLDGLLDLDADAAAAFDAGNYVAAGDLWAAQRQAAATLHSAKQRYAARQLDDSPYLARHISWMLDVAGSSLVLGDYEDVARYVAEANDAVRASRTDVERYESAAAAVERLQAETKAFIEDESVPQVIREAATRRFDVVPDGNGGLVQADELDDADLAALEADVEPRTLQQDSETLEKYAIWETTALEEMRSSAAARGRATAAAGKPREGDAAVELAAADAAISRGDEALTDGDVAAAIAAWAEAEAAVAPGAEEAAEAIEYAEWLELVERAKGRIAAGSFHNVAIGRDGRIWMWGDNDDKQAPSGVHFAEVRQVAAGSYHTIALMNDGTVKAWGKNLFGQTRVPKGLRAIAIGASISTSYAWLADGRIVAWGYYDEVPKSAEVIAIEPEFNNKFALQQDGKVVDWGNESNGKTSVPSELGPVLAIAAGIEHNLALQKDGKVVAWGSDSQGQSSVPADLLPAVAIAAGTFHSVALQRDGRVVAWGKNDSGQCDVPADLNNVIAIAAGYAHSVALCQDGRIVVWGLHIGEVPAGLDASLPEP